MVVLSHNTENISMLSEKNNIWISGRQIIVLWVDIMFIVL